MVPDVLLLSSICLNLLFSTNILTKKSQNWLIKMVMHSKFMCHCQANTEIDSLGLHIEYDILYLGVNNSHKCCVDM